MFLSTQSLMFFFSKTNNHKMNTSNWDITKLTSTITTVPPLSRHGAENFFSWYDYLIFNILLAISIGIGIYFGCFGNKKVTTTDYLMGGKKMSVLPVSISLVASHCSGITLLGIPADVYVSGASYMLAVAGMVIILIVTVYVFLPVFHKLQLTSTYEYLELRFDRRVRKCSSFLFALALVTMLPIVIYIPSLAFAAASGFDVHYVIPVICGICIFYTAIGGIKGLIWSDTIQFTLTFGVICCILFLGIKDTGGPVLFWDKVIQSKRMDFIDTSLDITKRDTIWALLIGCTFNWMAQNSMNQGCNQKFLSVPTLRKSQLVVLCYCFGMIIMKFVSVATGLLLAVKYADCDPFTTKLITRNDQLVPFYVLEVSKNIPGISGMFIAGVFCASLSSLSANLNSLSGTLYEDFLKEPLARKGIKNEGIILKVLVAIAGVACTLFVYTIEHLGGLLSVAIALISVANGPLLGMFFLGFLFPRANAKGAFHGATMSMIFMAIVVCGNNYYSMMKMISYPQKPISIDKCEMPLNTTFLNEQIKKNMAGYDYGVFPLFKISFYWYTMIGSFLTLILGLIISYFTEVPKVPKKLLSPVIYPFLGEDYNKDEAEYYGVDEALDKVDDVEMTEEKMKDLLRKLSYRSDVIET